MTGGRRIAVALVLAGLTFALGYLFNRTQAIDIEAQNRVMLDLRELEKLDAEWDVNILRSHIGLNLDYDALSAPLPRMLALRMKLAGALDMARDPAAAATFADLTRALQEKEELVEQFKSQNAILRNSLIYIPPAITDLKTELTGIEGALVPARTVLAMDAALNTLLSDLLRYNLAPDPELAAQIERNLASLQALRAWFSPTIMETVEEMVRHARAILHYRHLENDVEARIDASPTGENMARLSTLFDKSFDQVQVERQRFRSYLSAYSGLLLLLLVYAALRLRRSYRIIGKVNRDLKTVNESLEQRVAERTAALEDQAEQLKQLARHDGLTGLINYGELTVQLEHALLRAARRGGNVAIMFIDLDGFKEVNDTWGHATGDLVLKEVATRLQGRLRQEDALARLGGDEFVVLLEDVRDREGTLRVAAMVLDEIRTIDTADGHPVAISASVGVSCAHGREGAALGAARLLAEADAAMYAAKQGGKNRFALSPHAEWGQEGATLDAL